MNLVIDWQDQFLGEELWMHVGDLLVMSLGKELGLVRDICGLMFQCRYWSIIVYMYSTSNLANKLIQFRGTELWEVICNWML